jgi:hypothetical protein
MHACIHIHTSAYNIHSSSSFHRFSSTASWTSSPRLYSALCSCLAPAPSVTRPSKQARNRVFNQDVLYYSYESAPVVCHQFFSRNTTERNQGFCWINQHFFTAVPRTGSAKGRHICMRKSILHVYICGVHDIGRAKDWGLVWFGCVDI